jgi:mono/diheme cytochrome c family protein
MRQFRFALVASIFASLVAGSAQAADAAADRGREAYVRSGCWSCHGYEGQGGSTGPKIGPNPMPYPAFSAFVRTTTGAMPPFTEKVLPEEDLRALHAYLASRPAGPNPATIPILQ